MAMMHPPTFDHSDISNFSEPKIQLKNKLNAEPNLGPSSSQEIVLENNDRNDLAPPFEY